MDDRLAVEVLIGTAILNRHVIKILCTEQKIQFSNGDVPIVKQLTAEYETDSTPFPVRHWTKTTTREIEGEESLEAKKRRRTADTRRDEHTCECARKW